MALQAASPVWEFLGSEGLPNVKYPEDYGTSAVGQKLGYVHRNHKHGISMPDWLWMLEFAEKQLR